MTINEYQAHMNEKRKISFLDFYNQYVLKCKFISFYHPMDGEPTCWTIGYRVVSTFFEDDFFTGPWA